MPAWTPPPDSCPVPEIVSKATQCDSSTQSVPCTGDPVCTPIWTPDPGTCPSDERWFIQPVRQLNSVGALYRPIIDPCSLEKSVWTPDTNSCPVPETLIQTDQCDKTREVACTGPAPVPPVWTPDPGSCPTGQMLNQSNQCNAQSKEVPCTGPAPTGTWSAPVMLVRIPSPSHYIRNW